jgi:hypothetical protein
VRINMYIYIYHRNIIQLLATENHILGFRMWHVPFRLIRRILSPSVKLGILIESP